MCGGINIASYTDRRARLYWDRAYVDGFSPGVFTPNGNILAVINYQGHRALFALPWGFDGGAFKPINIRSETARTKPMFKSAYFAGNRCAVLANSFREKGGWFTTNSGVMCLAGLYDTTPNFGVGVLTEQAKHPVVKVHHRQPVVIENPQDVHRWLDRGDVTTTALRRLK